LIKKGSFMAEHTEKMLNLDEFKERVYKNIGWLEIFEDMKSGKRFDPGNKGCLGVFILPIISFSNRKWREKERINDLDKKADAILADPEIKKLLCEKLDATVALPIDAAYKITPVLYAIALEDEEKVPFDSMLFAIVSRKIVKQGVENFCGQAPTEEEKDGKAKDKKADEKPASSD